MFEELAKRKASELLLKICYLPFVAVGGMTVVIYDVSRMEKHPVVVFLVAATLFHAALFMFWVLVFKRILAGMLVQVSFSRVAANAGLALAYGGGLFIGWLVHKYG